MKEIKAIIEAYHTIDFLKNKAALATVIRVQGSSYRRAGARMLVIDSGEWIGGISGGCLEGDALKKAKFAIAQNKSSIITYDTTNDDPFEIGVGLGCNGIIDVLLTPINNEDADNQAFVLEKCINSREPKMVITVLGLTEDDGTIKVGQSFIDPKNEELSKFFSLKNDIKTLEGDLENCCISHKSIIKEYTTKNGKIKLFLEAIIPSTHLIIYGGNYDIYPLVKLSKEIGWRVSVVCNPLKIHKSLFKIADAVVSKEESNEIKIDDFLQQYEIIYHTKYKRIRKRPGKKSQKNVVDEEDDGDDVDDDVPDRPEWDVEGSSELIAEPDRYILD